MTKSSDKIPEIPNLKEKKPVGPFRKGFLIPMVIIFTTITVLGHYFLDCGIKKSVELASSYIHGAEVNIGNFQTSVINGDLLIENIEITD